MKDNNVKLVRVLTIRDNIFSFTTNYNIQECIDVLDSNCVVPSNLLIGCIDKSGSMTSDAKKIYDINEDGYIIIIDSFEPKGYHMHNIFTEYEEHKTHTNICVIDMINEGSYHHDFYILEKIGENQYRRLLESTDNIVNDHWNDPDACFITNDVISITFDKDDETNISGCILYNIKTNKSAEFEYNNGLGISHDDEELTYWTIGDYDEDDDYGDNDTTEQRCINLTTMESDYYDMFEND